MATSRFVITRIWRGYLDYLCAHPFSVMALANIVGDLCYVGFAFDAPHGVSYPKLCGAAFTIAAHIILLAHGDDEMRRVADESGRVAQFVLRLRGWANASLVLLPSLLRRWAKRRPVALSFGMLALNGAGLLMDALFSMGSAPNFAMMTQTALGLCIIIGCLAFVAADCVRSQMAADVFVKLGPTAFLAATVFSGGLALQMRNVFLICGALAFGLSNLAGFYTRIDKDAP